MPLEMDEYADEVKVSIGTRPLACIHVTTTTKSDYLCCNEPKNTVNMDYRGVEIKGVLRFVKSDDGIHGFDMVGQSAKEVNIEYEDPLLEILNFDIDE